MTEYPKLDDRNPSSFVGVPWNQHGYAGNERPTPQSVGREGMVTVWASDGFYLGCMGVETWENLLAEEARRGN